MEQTKEYKYKVSVVTAVYNVEDYLAEMIDSIIAQNIGFENVQLILIDDGSQDSSGEICDQYAAQYPENIVVVHKENGGVSSARNEGLKYVEGAYVNFTDADDKLYFNALDKMYTYLKNNEEWIDLVAIRTDFIGAKRGGHPLNYRFKKTRLVDLRKEHTCIQLAINSVLIKSVCFKNRKFDTGLSYAEDAQLVVDILLEKMRYGLVRGTCYLYRKRPTEDSALDLGRNKVAYYIPYMERFILYSLKNALDKRNYIPQFVQYTCMEDLQWRINKDPLVNPGVLSEEEIEKYKALIIQSLQYIDNKIILEQKNIGDNYKMALMLLKKNNKEKVELVPCPNDYKVCIEDISSAYASSYTMTYEFLDIFSSTIKIEGHIRYFLQLDNIEVIFKLKYQGIVLEEYKAEIFEREEKCTFCMDNVITQAKGFRLIIEKDSMPDKGELLLCIRYRQNDVICKNIIFGKFFPLSKQLKSSYLYQNELVITWSSNILKFEKINDKKVSKKYEKQFQQEILSKKDKMLQRGWIARNIYRILKRIKKKEIWLISDRLTKADDNGEAFFTYMNTVGKKEDIDTYFVLDKDSEDYERLQSVGKVVSFHSTKHKILSLLCDKIISSQGEDYVFNRFFNLSYLYKDIQHFQKFVFLQHGVTQNDLSNWLIKSNKNISLFITTTRMEYESILNYAYYYDENQVKCTGFPRYDYLFDNAQNVITFMPTWRAYLATNTNIKTDSRVLKKGFENSTYCQMYQQLFSNRKLCNMAEKQGYVIKLMLHPTMPRECIQYFNCDERIEILDRSTKYRDLFAESKLIVTDYSSVAFDFAYLRKPVLYYQKDAEEFFSGKHTLNKGYYNHEIHGFGEIEYTAEKMIERIIEYMQMGCQLKCIYKDRIEKTFPFNDKNNCKRVYEEIVQL